MKKILCVLLYIVTLLSVIISFCLGDPAKKYAIKYISTSGYYRQVKSIDKVYYNPLKNYYYSEITLQNGENIKYRYKFYDGGKRVSVYDDKAGKKIG